MAEAPKLDLIGLGRAGVDLYGQQIGGHLENMSTFAKYVGGSPTNTVIGAARLGLKVGLISRVGDDHMGRFILQSLEQEGVNAKGVRLDPDRLTALVILGILEPEVCPLIFYRENCADMALTPADIDVDWLQGAGTLLLSGTHLSRDNVYATSLHAAQVAKAAGRRVALDIDYRPVLWGLTAKDQGENRFVAAEAVTRTMMPIAPLCDLIVGTEEEICIMGGADTVADSLRAIRAATPAVIVCKQGARGCAIFDGPIVDDGLQVPGFAIDLLNVLGAGDAFCAGFLSGWLRGEDLRTCGRRANACGALVASRHACGPAMPTEAELGIFMNAGRWPIDAATRDALDHLNWVERRRRHYDVLNVLAIDHRVQLEQLAQEQGAEPGRIAQFKRLALKAVDAVAAGDGSFGVLLDGRLGEDALIEAAAYPYWIGRAIEAPKSRPIEFEASADVGMEIATWPSNHVVKCLVSYHPDDPAPLRLEQERQLLRLQDACRKTDHELLLEVIPPAEMPADDTTIGRALAQLYAIGVRPDWWKLEPQLNVESWALVQATIEAHDPHCRGVLLLGLNAPEADLVRGFGVAARFPCIKGFAVGRTLFQEAAMLWFANAITDDEAVDRLSRKFQVLIDAWRAALRAEERAA